MYHPTHPKHLLLHRPPVCTTLPTLNTYQPPSLHRPPMYHPTHPKHLLLHRPPMYHPRGGATASREMVVFFCRNQQTNPVGNVWHDTSGSFSRTKSSSPMVCGKIMFRVCCNDHERNRERVHSELYSLGTVCMCHAVWRNYMHMTHCSKSSGLSVCVCNNQ